MIYIVAKSYLSIVKVSIGLLLIIFFQYFACAQEQFTSIEAKFNPSIVRTILKGEGEEFQQITDIQGSSNELGLYVKHNYSPHFSVSTGVNGLNQEMEIEKIQIDDLGKEIGVFYEKQVYDMFSIPLVFSYHFVHLKSIKPFIAIECDHKFIFKYIEKYKNVQEPSALELKNRVITTLNDLKEAGNTLYNVDLGLSIGVKRHIRESIYYCIEPNVKFSLKKLKELNSLTELHTNQFGLRIGVGYRF